MEITKTFSAFCDEYSLSIPVITAQSLRGTKIGKILRRELIKGYNTPDMAVALNYAVQLGTCCWNAGLHVKRLKISSHYEDFILAYNNASIHSCMTNEAQKFAEFYIQNGVKVAYLTLDGKVTARTLVSGKLFSDLYGTQIEELTVALHELDYKDASCTIEKFMPDQLVLPRHADGEFYLPYIDTLGGKMFVEEWRTTNAIGLKHLDVLNPFDEDILDYEIYELEEFEKTIQQLDHNQMVILPNKEEKIIQHETFQQVQHTVLPVRQNPVSDYQVEYEAIIARKYEELNEVEKDPYWNLLMISGRMFWLKYRSDGQSSRWFMDDYGNVQNARFAPEYIIRTEIELGEFGHF